MLISFISSISNIAPIKTILIDQPVAIRCLLILERQISQHYREIPEIEANLPLKIVKF
jgi:hypothetical protein